MLCGVLSKRVSFAELRRINVTFDERISKMVLQITESMEAQQLQLALLN